MRQGLEWPFDLDCPWLVDPLGCLGPPWLMLLHHSGGFWGVRVLGMMEKDEEDRGREGKSQGVGRGVWEPRRNPPFASFLFFLLFYFILF